MTAASASGDRSARDVVRCYLLDHRTPLGKVIDVALLALNLVFVGVFVAETYALVPRVDALLWDPEVAIALVFLVEYVLRLYGARNRVAEAFNGYTVVDLLAILPTLRDGAAETADSVEVTRLRDRLITQRVVTDSV